MNTFAISCPTDCTTGLTMPILPATYCQLTPKRSEIDQLIFKGADAGPADMSSALNWATLIDNTDATGDLMKYLIGKGSVAAPEDTIVTVARDQEVISDRVYTLTYEVTELSDTATYAFLRTLQCGSLKPNIYYGRKGGFLYGKNGTTDDGIEINSISVAMPKEVGKEAIDKAIITIKWSATTDPDRVVNPLTI